MGILKAWKLDLHTYPAQPAKYHVSKVVRQFKSQCQYYIEKKCLKKNKYLWLGGNELDFQLRSQI